MADSTIDPVLKKLRSELDAMYGNRIERIVLFGSRARGDSHVESDYDIAVFLRGLTDRWAEADRLADLRIKFLEDADAFLDIKPFRAGYYAERTPLMREVRLEGRDL